ncbi:WD40 repeat domain-containing protein [Sporobolomyces salmoneus]|uniref:WD40 repeat domain-containing protein n=1 Tax=Sporobolomyces salmoneus TaxID=183962 RepID=UPI00317ED6E0
MSATYLLEGVSPASSNSSVLPRDNNPTSPPPTPGGRSNGHSDAVWCTRWANRAQGGQVVLTGSADHTIKIWNPAAPTNPARTVRPPKSLGIVGLDVDKSPQGASFFVSNSIDSVVSRFNLDGVQEGRKQLGPAESWGLSLNPRQEVMATAGNEGRVKVLWASTEDFGNELATLDASGQFGSAVRYSNGGNLLAVASETGYVTLFDSETGSLVSTFPAHSAPIRSITFTSSLLITASDDKRVNVFDLRALTAASTGAAGGGSRRGQVASLGGHEGWVVSVEARNERLLASGSADGTIKLFDLSAPSSALSTLRDHSGDVWSLAWAPETGAASVEGLGGASAGLGGGRLVSGGEDGALRWWRGGGT